MEIIHIVLGKANPDRMNGVNKVVFQLASKQVEFGQNVSVWGISNDTEKNYGERNFETLLFIKKSNPFCISTQLKQALIDKKGKAIFHIHGGWIPVFYTLAKILFKHNIPYVFTPHGAYNIVAMKRNFWVKKVYFNLFEKTMLKNTSKIHCIGKSEITGVNSLFKSNKTVLIPYGFENNATIEIENSKNNNVVFGFIGRLDIYTKGLDTMIAAFKIHLKNNPNAQLWIVGDSNEKAKLNQLIVTKQLQNSVTLFGGKFGKEKENLLQQMDIFIHPSRNEGLPTSVIEAASYGKPSIVTEATNIGELICDCNAGLVVQGQNIEELEKAMQKLTTLWNNQDDFKNARTNAILMVKENFNWRKITKEFNSKLYYA